MVLKLFADKILSSHALIVNILHLSGEPQLMITGGPGMGYGAAMPGQYMPPGAGYGQGVPGYGMPPM